MSDLAHAHQSRGDVVVVKGKLHGEIGDIHTLAPAPGGHLLANLDHIARRRVPVRRAFFGQQSHMQRRRIYQTDAVFFGRGRQHAVHGGVEQIIAAVRENGVHPDLRDHVHNLHQGVAGNAYEADFAAFGQRAQGRQRFVNDLRAVAILDIVDLNHVDKVGAQAAQAFIHRVDHAARRVVELVDVIATDLGGQNHLVALALQELAQPGFCQRATIIWRYVEVIDATIDGVMDSAPAFFRVDFAKLGSQRRCTVTNNRDPQPGLPQCSIDHTWLLSEE